MTRSPLVGISMKIYKNHAEEMVQYARNLKEKSSTFEGIDIFMFPSMGTLFPVAKELENSHILYGAQNIAPTRNGAYTGEFSIESLVELNGSLVEIGHYERRSIFNETNEMIANKVKLAVDNDLQPVLCIGEPEIWEKDRIKDYLTKQITEALSLVEPRQLKKVILAYEPVWAIGKSKSADAEHVHAVHKIIRDILGVSYHKYSDKVRVIYGGSVSAQNAKDILDHEYVDGVFVGRFGHNINNFLEIIQTTIEVKQIKVGQ